MLGDDADACNHLKSFLQCRNMYLDGSSQLQHTQHMPAPNTSKSKGLANVANIFLGSIISHLVINMLTPSFCVRLWVHSSQP